MVDVCLVVEGSYPYVTGGVSKWVHDVVGAQPDVRFAVAHVGGEGSSDQPRAYTLPGNAELTHVVLDPEPLTPPAGLEARLPDASVYHAAISGAAGELARRAAAERGAGFALTEHGIAWREARWAPAGCKGGIKGLVACKGGIKGLVACKGGIKGSSAVPGGEAPERPMTVAERDARAAAIAGMARAAYAEAGAVTSVCGPNLALQAAAGAPRDRLRLIPNPVAEGDAREEHDGLLVGFVGRVVAIKDVETFLRACAAVAAVRGDARFVVVGPTHHEPGYALRCRALAAELGIAARTTFTGETDPAPWYRRLDVLALTSLSEAQPLVALEAMAHGIPVVATDVGGCREAIGDAGLVTPARDHAATARAVLRLAHDPELRAAAGRAGRRRARGAHSPARVHGAYRELYERLAA